MPWAPVCQERKPSLKKGGRVQARLLYFSLYAITRQHLLREVRQRSWRAWKRPLSLPSPIRVIRGECVPIEPDNLLEHAWLNWHRKVTLKPNDRQFRVPARTLLGDLLRSKATYARHARKHGGRTESVCVGGQRIDQLFDRRHKINRGSRSLSPLLLNETIYLALVDFCRGHTLKDAFVCQFLSELMERQFATRA